jgi:methylenetetrahydrofolate reductase (NADPH)
VTCGAGGSGEDGTFSLACGIQERFSVPVAAHLTCACSSRAEIDALVGRYWDNGIRRIVALRGDAPKGAERYEPRPDGYAYAADLVRGLKAVADFEISVGCYPETHPEAASAEADLDNVRRKVEAGAVRLITQYCFDTDRILRFRDRLVAAGIDAEYVPGIMPIHNFAQIRRFSLACGASIPAWLERLFDGVPESSPTHGMIAASVAAEQCRRLAAEGLTRMHVYALNRAELPLAIRQLLGSRPVAAAA